MPKAETTEVAVLEAQTPPESSELRAWALVELFGHQRIVGWLTEQKIGSDVLLRIDVPDLLKDGKIVRQGFTRYFGAKAIYSITPVTEAVVRELLPSIDGTPGVRPLTMSSWNGRDREDWG